MRDVLGGPQGPTVGVNDEDESASVGRFDAVELLDNALLSGWGERYILLLSGPSTRILTTFLKNQLKARIE